MRILDRPVPWNWVGAICAMLVSLALSAAIVEAVTSSERQRNQTDDALALAHRVERTAAAERKEASRERQQVLAGQRRLQKKYDTLIEYISSIGVTVPSSVYRGANVSRGNDGDGSTTVIRRRTTNNSGGSSGGGSSSGGGGGSDSGGSKSGNSQGGDSQGRSTRTAQGGDSHSGHSQDGRRWVR